MPDEFGFDCLPNRAGVYHRCIECGWPEWGVLVSEADRKRHHSGHARQRKLELAKKQKANLALARRARKQYRQEGEP